MGIRTGSPAYRGRCGRTGPGGLVVGLSQRVFSPVQGCRYAPPYRRRVLLHPGRGHGVRGSRGQRHRPRHALARHARQGGNRTPAARAAPEHPGHRSVEPLALAPADGRRARRLGQGQRRAHRLHSRSRARPLRANLQIPQRAGLHEPAPDRPVLRHAGFHGHRLGDRQPRSIACPLP